MSVDATSGSLRCATRPDEVDTPPLKIDGDVFAIDWHRTAIHVRPQHACVLCPPTPCACGFTGECCPGYSEHRRNWAASESTWREAA